MKLTELKIKNLKPRKSRYLLSDGGGLSIAVMPTGEKYWYYRTWENGKERKISIGRYPDIGLKEARELKYSFKSKAKDAPVILSKVTQEWYAARCAPVLANGTLKNKRYHIEKLIIPALGGRDMKTIGPQDVLSFIRGIQASKSLIVAHKTKNTLSQIFQYAIAAGLCEWNPVQQISGALTPPPPPQHRAVIKTPDEAQSVLQAVNGYAGNSIVRLGLLILAYTFVRPGEMRLAEWREVDFEAAEWRIPAERMKMRREHAVPLSSQVLALFSELRSLTRHPVYCFAMPLRDKPMSKTLFPLALRSLGYGVGKMTPHGFRGMASTLLNEHGFPPDVIERQLAHAETNAVRAAYNRAEHLDERRKMMQWWGDYVENLIKS